AIKHINGDADWAKAVLGPDFPTGGILLKNDAEFEKIYSTGRGSVKLRAKYRFDKRNSVIEIYEIPYSTNIEAIIDKIILGVKAGKLKDITDVRDETDLSGLKIAIDIRKSADPDKLMQRLYAMTPLQDSVPCNFNLLIDGRPKTLGIGEILGEWTRFRINSVRGQLGFDIAKKSEKMHLLEGLQKILVDIDRAIAIIRQTEKESEVVPNLMSGFDIDEIQAEYIAEIKLRNINREYILNRTAELSELQKELERLKDILGSEKKIRKLICDKLRAVIKKYGAPRKTDIIAAEETAPVPEEELVEDYGIRLFLTKEGYFKKISLVSMRSAGAQKLKEDDEIYRELSSTNRADILFFSDRRNMYRLKANDAPDTKASAMGEYLNNLLGMEEGEKIVDMVATTDYSGYLIFFYSNGKVGKVPASSYRSGRRKLLNAASPKGGLLAVKSIAEERDFVLIRDRDKAILFNTELIPLVASKSTGGVTVYNLKKNSVVSAAYEPEEFMAEDKEYYRILKIPSTGHFITDGDREKNGFLTQIKLF
ncbi:MAG: topoisomerase IV, partial [Firmicutes bacterium]|nr:topoisomerase IV [Bacillota bacterium]